MRRVLLGSALVLSLAIASVGSFVHHSRAFGQQGFKAAGRHDPNGLIALSSDGPTGYQQVTVIDAVSRVMSVYHIEHASGKITLKSVRSIEADLLMDEFNTGAPLPREIRAMLNNP